MNGNIAIITGASRGLGRNAALHLAAQGVAIIGTYHSNKAEADSLVREITSRGGRAAMLQLDAGNSASFDSFVAAVNATLIDFGKERFDYLINNAGIGLYGAIAETTETQFDQL